MFTCKVRDYHNVFVLISVELLTNLLSLSEMMLFQIDFILLQFSNILTFFKRWSSSADNLHVLPYVLSWI